MLSHGLVNRADIGLVRTVAAVVRRSTWPEGICVCVALFLWSHVLHCFCIHLDILCILVCVSKKSQKQRKLKANTY